MNKEKNNYDIVAIVHRIFTEDKRKKGGFDKVLEYFSKRGKNILLIEHPLFGHKECVCRDWSEMIISYYENGEIKEIERKKILLKEGFKRCLFEIYSNIKYIKGNIKGKPMLFSSDPLNSMPGVFYFWKFRKKYHHFVDYSNRRFAKKEVIMNFFYRLSVFLTISFFDLISVVSLRTRKRLMQMGCRSDKIFYLPNSPNFKILNIPKSKDNILIYASGWIVDKYNYDFIVELLYKLKKTIPDILLYAVGGTDVDIIYFKKITKKIKEMKLKKNIIFTGFLESERLHEYLLKSKIGLSLLTNDVSYYSYFADSLKTREYALYGIPTVTNGCYSTDEEMVKEGCGFIAVNLEETVNTVKLLLGDKSLYRNYSINCLKWAKKMDKQKLLKNLERIIYN